ncbi:GNAT family N-acetyltransferase [Nocardioides lianchengensis]|uniref:Ribosomal protein S18 acetylase RimI n=1 Tax=Nocardioides lianchengensis TaxID=1045774 RepID=A0A1G6MYB1_9ACTN|nr:GNAT family N-acetyltransferase [Nocardioides lianchengensis]NYG10591.1 GNAT superfamily N-acetyltransferase [Nocardioides lianchengensis]SDC60560.1 Ribosomal protein S18 acetylase RimI [Nocardioides lianchengensis]
MSEVLLRPMRVEDVPVAERLSAESFYELDVRLHRPGLPVPERRPPTRADNWITRTTHFLDTDPGGCWVAEVDGELVGFATSFVRELTWFLATFAVRPGLQGRGLGKRLLDAAMEHGRGCLRGMLSASSDPKAVRRYRLAGFSLHPQMFLSGTVDRSAIPVVGKVREGTAGDVDLLDSLDRRTRGSAHGPDHALMLASWRLLVSDTSTGSGYAYAGPDGSLALLAASDRRTASRLLWAVLADTTGETLVPHLTAANEWAVDVGLAARLDLHQEGYLGLRGMKPPAPYVHNGALL